MWIRVAPARQTLNKKKSIDKVRDKTESSGKGIRSTRVINSFTDKEFISPDRVSKSLPFLYIFWSVKLCYQMDAHPRRLLRNWRRKLKKIHEHTRARTQAHTVEWLELQTSAVFCYFFSPPAKIVQKRARKITEWIQENASAKRKLEKSTHKKNVH